MNLRMRFGWLLLFFAVLMGCARGEPIPATVTGTRAAQTEAATAAPTTPVARDAGSSVSARVEELLGRMTLEEKIGQMTQVENGSIKPGDVTARFIGSVLSGGDGAPRPDDQGGWLKMVSGYQSAALKTRLAIPLIYGVDAVHGFGGLRGATLYPHNIGLGATRDPELVRRIGRATAEEMAAVGIFWNFAPVVAVPQDIRWGRTYEAYGESTDLVASLGAAYIHGLQEGSPMVAATAKHF
ncbi:MAG: glycoside hydrolase family 3 N-terminal domain-containing protein, partial [Acidobacteriota bacterium]